MSEDGIRHHQIKAEVIVDLQRDLHRVLNEQKQDLLQRFDQRFKPVEDAVREGIRDHEDRLRRLQELVPSDLRTQLQELRDQSKAAKGRSDLVLWLVPILLSVGGLILAFLRP